MDDRFGVGGERLLSYLDAAIAADFTCCEALCDEVVFISNLAEKHPFQAAILSLLRATYPFQVGGLNVLALADIVLDSILGGYGFAVEVEKRSNRIKMVKGSHVCSYIYKLEAGDGYKSIKEEADEDFKGESGVQVSHAPPSIRMVEWSGDWDIFKRTLRSTALCSGTDSAVRLAEKLAKGQKLTDIQTTSPDLIKRGVAQSRRLHAQLMLSLIKTAGPQQALLESGFEDDEDGVAIMTRLIKHFEYTTKELRALELHSKWARETLQPGEHPSLLYTRLLGLQRQLAALGEDLIQ